MGILLVSLPDAEANEIWSFYPLLEGIPNQLKICKVAQWVNGVEASVLAEPVSGSPRMSFYAPCHFRESDDFAQNKETAVHLAALATRCNKGESHEFVVQEGPFYEIQLKEFLEENPDKNEADFTAPKITMTGSRVLLPTGYASEWQFRCPVEEEPENFYILGESIQRVKVGIPSGLDEEPLYIYLYIPQNVYRQYLSIGDDIEGIFWLSGYVHEVCSAPTQTKKMSRSELEARLTQVSKIEAPEFETEKILCYSMAYVPPNPREFECPICHRSFTQSDTSEDLFKAIVPIVEKIKGLGYDAKVEEICAVCGYKGDEDDVTIQFSFRTEDEQNYHTTICTDINRYKAALTFLESELEYGSQASITFICNEIEEIEDMLGLHIEYDKRGWKQRKAEEEEREEQEEMARIEQEIYEQSLAGKTKKLWRKLFGG